MATDRLPQDENGLQPCDWCGGPIQQPATGRRRRYCSRTHRELAYRERKTVRRVDEAVAAVLPPAPRPPADGEECPYCRDVVVGLVAHLRRCSARPDSSVDETRSVGSVS